MTRPVSLLLRIATLCLFLGLAWIHLYWEKETPYGAAIERYGQILPSVDPYLLSWGVGGWFLASGLAIIVWRPAWLVTFFVLLSMAPLSLLAFSHFAANSAPVSSLLGSAALLATPLVLCLGDVLGWAKFGRFLARFALSISFLTFGLQATGLHYHGELPELPEIGAVELGTPQPEAWLGVVAELVPQLEPLKQKLLLRIFGGLALVAALGIWSPLMTSISAISMSLLALTGSAIITTAHLDGDTLATLHRWAPETILRMPLVLLPIALWQMKLLTDPHQPVRKQPRKLRRVDPAADDFEIIMDDDDRFVSVDEIR